MVALVVQLVDIEVALAEMVEVLAEILVLVVVAMEDSLVQVLVEAVLMAMVVLVDLDTTAAVAAVVDGIKMLTKVVTSAVEAVEDRRTLVVFQVLHQTQIVLQRSL